MSFKFDANTLQKGMSLFEDKSLAAINVYAEQSAIAIEKEAKLSAPWTDRTGTARRRLSCKKQPRANGVRLVLSQGVDYGIWLELANEQKYAIIQPTILKMSPIVLQGFKRMMSKMK